MNQAPIYVFAKWHVQPGHLQQVLQLLKTVIIQSRNEPGNLLYNAHQSQTDENIIALYEAYTGNDAVEHHRNTPHFKQIVLAQIVPLLAGREVLVAGDVLQ